MKRFNQKSNTPSAQANNASYKTKKAHSPRTTQTKSVILPQAAPQRFTALNTKLFNYAGSKLNFEARFVELHRLHGGVKEVKTYIEAFAGTLASFFHNLTYVKAERFIINDFNPRIINLYRQIKENPLKLFLQYKQLEDEFDAIIPEHLRGKRIVPEALRESDFAQNQAFYHETRDYFNALPLNVSNAALFLFLMKHNFNGLYTENQKGAFNTSFNWSAKKINTDAIKESIDNLHHFFTTHDVVFESMDVFELIQKYQEEDTFIYLDPPYSNSTVQYGDKHKKGAGTFNDIAHHQALIKACQPYRYVMYSNNFEACFEASFDTHVTFKRPNFGTKKSQLPTLEILAIKTNVSKTHYMPISLLLGLQEGLVPVNTNYHKRVQLPKEASLHAYGYENAS